MLTTLICRRGWHFPHSFQDYHLELFCKKSVPSFWFVTYLYQYKQVFILLFVLLSNSITIHLAQHVYLWLLDTFRLATLPFWYIPIIFWALSEFLLLLNEHRITVHFPCFCPGISQFSREFHRILKILKVLTECSLLSDARLS